MEDTVVDPIDTRLAALRAEIALGTRVVHDEGRYRGTVRAVEALDPRGDGKRAVMLGVEWDEPRGRHDGTAGGTRYFTCPDKHGSFVAPGKVHAAASLEDVLTTRFTDDFAAVVNKVDNLMSKDPTVRDPETGAFPNVWNVDCSAHPKLGRVASAGPNLGLLFPAIRQLSINAALLESWAEVARIAAALPLLETYSVRGNPLGPIKGGDLAPLEGGRAPQRLTKLNATATGIHPPCLAKLLAVLPHVAELNAGGNDAIRSAAATAPVASHLSLLAKEGEEGPLLKLESLSFDGNEFRSLDDVADLLGDALCQRLVSLNLNNAPVGCLRGIRRFPRLEKLMLRGCAVAAWDGLLPVHDTAPQLRHLCFSSEHLDGMLDTGAQRRQHVVAMMPKHVSHLNLSFIRDSEWNTARQAVMTEYIKRVEEENAQQDAPADVIEAAAAHPALPEVVRRLIREQRNDGVEIFVPKPKRIELELSLRVHLLHCDTATFKQHSRQHFSSLLTHANADASSRRRELDTDALLLATPRAVAIEFATPVRQSVASLRRAVAGLAADEESLHVHTIAATAGVEAAAIAADFRRFTSGAPPVDEDDKRVMVLVHVDSELSENPGAVARGFHLNDLHPDNVNLHNWRISSGDHLIAVLVTDGAAHGLTPSQARR